MDEEKRAVSEGGRADEDAWAPAHRDEGTATSAAAASSEGPEGTRGEGASGPAQDRGLAEGAAAATARAEGSDGGRLPFPSLASDRPNPLDGTAPAWRGHKAQDFALVLEGGSMRGLFTAGVTDFMLDHGLFARLVVGTSAGALNGVNYVAGATGRTCYLNCKHCADWHWLSMRNYVTTGNAVGSMLFEDGKTGEDRFDASAFDDSPMTLVSVASDLETGDADYHVWRRYGGHEMAYLKASSAMPMVSQVVHVDGKALLDGGVCDSVPYLYAMLKGYKKVVVVLTRQDGYEKRQNPLLGLAMREYRDYPLFLDRMAHRHFEYNLAYRRVKRMAQEGKLFVVRPPVPVEVGAMEDDPRKLFALYEQGYEQMALGYDRLLKYLRS